MTTHLFVLQPAIVFEARVNMASITYPLDEIVYDGVTLGSHAAIRPGMLIVIGSAYGLDNRGRQRVRKVSTSTQIFVGRSSRSVNDGEFDIADNDYIRVLDLYQVWSKVQRIDTDGTIYKDSDLVVGDNTTNPPPVANIGPGFAATINPITGVISAHFDGSDSFATAAGTITFLWEIEDGTLVSGTLTSFEIAATFPAGFRYIHLTVTDASGKKHTAHCPVYARDPARELDGTVPSVFQIDSQKITLVGQQLSITMFQDIWPPAYPDGTLVMVWDKEPIDGFDRSHMFFTGWLHTEPATITAQRTGTIKTTTLNCLDVGGKLDVLGQQPQSITNDQLRITTGDGAVPAITWSYMVNPTIDKYLHYLLHWHSTALDVADFVWSGTSSIFPFTVLTSDGASLWDQVTKRAEALTPDYHLTCNRRGQLRILPDPMIQQPGDRTTVVQANLTATDWTELRFVHQRPPRAYWLRGSAISTNNRIVFEARVNQATFNFPIAEIIFDTVTVGAFTQVHAQMEVTIGTSAGANDHGAGKLGQDAESNKIFVESSAQGVVYGTFDPADNDYIRVTTIDTFFCVAPGFAPGQGAAAQEDGNRLSQSQNDLNNTIGHLYARVNFRDSLVTVTLVTSDDFTLDPADLTWVKLTLPPELAAQRGFQLTAARGLVNEMNIRYDYQRTGVVRTIDLTWERETTGKPAVTVVI